MIKKTLTLFIYRREVEPEDKNNLVYYVFVLFGIGSLLPWNAVLTALDFFSQNFPHHKPNFTFSLTLNAPNFIFNFVGIFAAKHVSLKLRFIVGLIWIFGLTLAMPFVTEYLNEGLAWGIILPTIAVLGIANSFVQGGAFGFAGMFPFKYTGAVMLGNGFSGLSLNILRMICLAIFPPSNDDDSEDNSAFIGCLIYFAIASIVVILNIIGYLWVCKTDFAKYYIRKADTKVGDEDAAIIAAASRGSGSFGGNLVPLNYTPTTTTTNNNCNEVTEESYDSQKEPKSFIEVYKDIGIMAIQVFVCFLITFIVFPGTTLSTQFDFLGTTNRDFAWFAVLMITAFNLFDTIGRFAGGYIQIFTPNTVFLLTTFRLVFIPLFVLIQLEANPAWIFQSDWFRILNMALFAITNGYNSTLCMIYGPTLADEANKERAGLIMNFHLVGGIFAGSLIASFAMDKI